MVSLKTAILAPWEGFSSHLCIQMQVTLGTNYFGPLLLTTLLLDTLKESAPARIVNQGSPIEQLSGGVYWDDLK